MTAAARLTGEECHVSQEDFRDDVPLANLHLDPENPRLPRGEDWASKDEVDLLSEFYRRYNLVELAYSIADKGFSPRHAEALLVVHADDSDSHYTVVEGNRRLATLKLLTNLEYRRRVGATNANWDELAERAAPRDLDPVPVVVYEDRSALDDYLGFRHITGPTPWRPEAKARFIAKLLASGESIGEVARRIGSNHRTVRRFAEAHAIYDQALECGLVMDQVEAAFGVFYNALDPPGVRSFLGLGRQSDIDQLPDAPIPNDSIDQLNTLIGLLYGDEDGTLERVIKESRDLKKLGEVLANDRGRENLLEDRDLERAWRLTGGGRKDLLALLDIARSRLYEANGQANEFRDDREVREEVQRIFSLVTEMHDRFGLSDS